MWGSAGDIIYIHTIIIINTKFNISSKYFKHLYIIISIIL